MSRLFAHGSILLLVACSFDRDRPGDPADAADRPPPSPDAAACQPGGRYADLIFGANEIRVRGDVLYTEVTDVYGTHELLMDIYLPPESDPVRERPLIVWVHGGKFQTGSRANMTDYAIELARRGWVAASIEYRLLRALDPDGRHCPHGQGQGCSTDACAAVAQADTEAAIAFLRGASSTYGIDPARIVVAGFSAGSITSFTVGYEYEAVGATASPVIGVAGLDGLGSMTDDFTPGDPPFILIRSAEVPPDDPDVIDEVLAAVTEIGIANASHVIPGTVHTDLNKQPYIPVIAGYVAPFLHQHALACATQ